VPFEFLQTTAWPLAVSYSLLIAHCCIKACYFYIMISHDVFISEGCKFCKFRNVHNPVPVSFCVHLLTARYKVSAFICICSSNPLMISREGGSFQYYGTSYCDGFPRTRRPLSAAVFNPTQSSWVIYPRSLPPKVLYS
jgi:hypothetical protein